MLASRESLRRVMGFSVPDGCGTGAVPAVASLSIVNDCIDVACREADDSDTLWATLQNLQRVWCGGSARESEASMAVTLKDVAQQAGVSVATASRAFPRPALVGARSLARVREAADTLGYAPNRTARALITGRAGVYGVIVPDLENPFFPAVLKGAQARAHQLGAQLLITDAGESPDGELPL